MATTDKTAKAQAEKQPDNETKQDQATKQPDNEAQAKLDALYAQACKVHGIEPEHVFAKGMADDGAVVIVTNGGSKVRWFKGDKPVKLTRVQITGQAPEK